MNALEMDRVSTVGVIGLIVFCFFGTIMGLLARMKGYSFLAWFGTGGTLLVSALALAFQPKLRGVELSAEELDRSRRRGNGIGWLIGVVNYMLVTFAALLPAIQNFARLEAKDYFQLYIVPAYNWADLAYMAGVVLILLRFAFMPRGSRSTLLIVVFTVMALHFAWSLIGGQAVVLGGEDDSWAKISFMFKVCMQGVSGLVFLALAYMATVPREKASDQKL